MCGIVGYVEFDSIAGEGKRLASMAGAIAHRGPDDEGFLLVNTATGRHVDLSGGATMPGFADQASIDSARFPHNIGMGHRRFAIIDLSASGHQPMWSACGAACITFNGEVYNYVELREELRGLGYVFRTRSDTEVLLVGYLAWGCEVFQKLNGFYAVAIYDSRKRAVLLARDRLGKAHLYLTRKGGRSVMWASEIKSLIGDGGIDRSRVDVAAVADYVIFNSRDRAGTFWTEIEDFPPGHYAWLDSARCSYVRYWELPRQRQSTADVSRDAAALGLRELLTNGLEIRMRADVPLAFELSGGMDSSALVALAVGALGRNLTTYTIRFREEHSNEEPFARLVASQYPGKVDYRVVEQTARSFWEDANEFVWLQEEPFHSPNLHTNQYLRRAMKEDGAHVVITGSAGDEVLAGYPRDYFAPFLRHLLRKGDFSRAGREMWKNTELSIARSLRGVLVDSRISEETMVGIAHWRTGERALLRKALSQEVLGTKRRRPSDADERAFHGLTLANLTYRRMNYWLRSGTKSNYGIPIEARAPFLDYRVVEYCSQLPPEYLIYEGWHKHVLRLAVEDLMPSEVVWRRAKMGFPFPLREWLSSSRRLVAQNLADIECPFVDAKWVLGNYERFVESSPALLWRLISLGLWWRRIIEQRQIMAE